MAKLKVDDLLRVREDTTFTRCLPVSGYKIDGDVYEHDKYRMRAGEQVTVAVVYDSNVAEEYVRYQLRVGPEISIELDAKQVAKYFELVSDTKS